MMLGGNGENGWEFMEKTHFFSYLVTLLNILCHSQFITKYDRILETLGWHLQAILLTGLAFI